MEPAGAKMAMNLTSNRCLGLYFYPLLILKKTEERGKWKENFLPKMLENTE